MLSLATENLDYLATLLEREVKGSPYGMDEEPTWTVVLGVGLLVGVTCSGC